MHAARPFVVDGDPGLGLELCRERGPFLCGQPCPALIMRRAVALALHPNEPDIATRGAERHVALVEECHPQTRADETVGDRRADQPAADYDRIVALHLAALFRSDVVAKVRSWMLKAG